MWLIFLIHVLSFWGSALFALQRAPRETSSLSLGQILPLVAINQFLVTPVSIGTLEYIAGSLIRPLGTDPSPLGTDPSPLGTDPSPLGTDPSPLGTDPSMYNLISSVIWELFLSPFQYALMLLILNTAFALVHYSFHRIRWLYHNVHSVHHKLKIAHPIGAIYAHPVEHLVANLAPVGIALVLVRPNAILALIFVAHVSYDTAQAHTSFLDRDLASNHNLHHSKITCNYDNSPYVFDRLVGTYRDFRD